MLKDIPDSELQELASRGVQIVWFMGTWKLGKAGLEHDRTDPNLLKSSVLPACGDTFPSLPLFLRV